MAGPDRNASAASSSRHGEKKVQPPRPPNAWILYRSYKSSEINQSDERLPQASVSKIVSDMWKNETENVKRYFEQMADARKAEHQQLYPDYRYAPRKKEDKVRAKEDRKQSRLAKRSKARDATSANATTNATTSTTAAMPVPPPLPFMPQHFLVPDYHPNMMMPHPYLMSFLPGGRYGPCGTSAISAAPSPILYESSESSGSQPRSAGGASSSSSPSTRPSSSSDSQASTSPSQILVNPFYIPTLPGSHQSSPNLNATQPLPTLLDQTSVQSRVPSTSSQEQPPPENGIVNVLPSPQNSKAVVKLTLPIHQTDNLSQLSRCVSDTPSLDCSQGLISRTGQDGIFSFANMDTNFLTQPQGDLEVAMGSQASAVDYRGEPFVDYELLEFQRQMAPFTEGDPSYTPVGYPPIQEDLKDLFRVPKNLEDQGDTDVQQRHPSLFTEDMMNFLDFDAIDAIDGSTEDTSPIVSPDALPISVDPQQMLLQSDEHAATTPIFAPVTNTPTVASTPYVPPAGAINSSTRRVAGSWKSPFTIPPSYTGEPDPWTLPPN